MRKLKLADKYRQKYKRTSSKLLLGIKEDTKKRLSQKETDEDRIKLGIIEEVLSERKDS